MPKTMLQQVQERETELADLWSRMDNDKALYYLESYVMKKLDRQKEPEDAVYNVTMNDPATFAGRANSVLSGAFRQEVVESKTMTDAETTVIEEFIRAALWEIDRRLGNIRIPGMFPYNVEKANIRGRISARVLMRRVNGELVLDVQPVDPRFVSWRDDFDGLKWWSYTISREKEDIEAFYNVTVQEGEQVVRDIWTRDRNIVYVGDRPVSETRHDYGEVPCIYVMVPIGSMLADTDRFAHEGESIYWMDRALYPELNRAATILQTLNVMTFTAGLIWNNEVGIDAQLPDEDPRISRGITAIGINEKMGPIQIQDMRNSTRQFLAMLEGRLQRGSLTALDFGNLTFPLSAVAIARLTEGRDQVFVPRIQGLALYDQQLIEMLIRQVVKRGMPLTIGPPDRRRTFTPDQLVGDYTIKFRYFSESPEQTIANYAVADAARNAGLPQIEILRDIIKHPNPTGAIMARRAEDTEKLDPVVQLYRHIVNLIEEGRDVEAKLMKPTLMNMIRLREQPAGGAPPAPAQPPPQVGGGQSLVPLLGGGSGRRNPETEGEGEKMLADEADRQQMADINQGRRQAEGANA